MIGFIEGQDLGYCSQGYSGMEESLAGSSIGFDNEIAVRELQHQPAPREGG